MNPQMQNYQRFAQQQASRAPASARRPGECDSSTEMPHSIDRPPPLVAPGLVGPVLPRPLMESQTNWRPISPQASLPHFTPWSPASTPRNNYGPPEDEAVAQQPLLPAPTTPFTGSSITDNALASLALSPETLKRLRKSAQLELMQPQNLLRLGIPKMNRDQSSRMDNLVPNHNANLAAQQHQAQLYQQQMAQRNAALEHQLAQRRARKPTDRNMPDGIEDLIVGDGVQQYKDLRELEKRLDYTIMRKRLDIQDTMNRNVRRQKTMRIWINNTCENQPWQRPALDENSFDFDTGADSTFRLSIQGKLLDDDDDLDSDSDEDQEMEGNGDTETPAKAPKPAPKKFSHYFKAISVEYEKNRMNPNMPIDPSMQMEWKKTPQTPEFDCVDFTRKADENLNITISLVRDEPVERYRLSNALANALDMEEADRAEVVMGIWEYVKAMGLQEDDERRMVRCDERLRSIFNTDAFLFPQVAERIMPHLHPLPPIKLAYTIRVDQDFQSTGVDPLSLATIYDVRITTEDPLRAKIMAITSSSQSTQNLRQIAALDDQLAVVIQAIHHHKAKHTFYTNFARDPVNFLKKWYASQQRDLSVILGEMERGDVAGIEFAKGGKEGIWGSEIVEEAVRYKLARNEAMKGQGH